MNNNDVFSIIFGVFIGLFVGVNGFILIYAICAVKAISHIEKKEDKYLKEIL